MRSETIAHSSQLKRESKMETLNQPGHMFETQPRTYGRSAEGFTMIEAVIAMMVAVIGLVSIAGMFNYFMP